MRKFLPFTVLALAGLAPAQQELYVHGADGVIYRVDNYATQPTPVMLGTAVLMGTDLPTDLALDPVTGDFFMTAFPDGNASGRSTYRVDRNTFAATEIGGFGLFSFNSLDASADGRLFGVGALFGYIAVFDTTTGREHAITTAAGGPTAGDVATDVDGTLLMTNQLGDLGRYDPVTGTTQIVGTHGLGGSAFGLEVDTDGTIYIITDVGDIYTYDIATSVPAFVGPTGLQVYGCAFKLPADTGLGDAFSYCGDYTVPNSSGLLGQVSVSGSTVATDNNLTLHATNLPPNQFGIFLTARFGEIEGPFGNSLGSSDGHLCTRDTTPGIFNSPGQILQADVSGQMSLTVDLNAIPSGAGISSVTAGSSMIFQSWFRDATAAGSNYTNGIMVIFR